MAGTRSPGYPVISIGEAIRHAKSIFDKEHTAPMTPGVAAEHIGYKGLNGASLRVISSLKKFGLLDGRGDNLAITNDAVTIIADEKSDDQSERINALNRSLLNSSLFVDLHERFQGKSSEQNIAAQLTKSGFKPDAAKMAASVYLESVRFVESASKTDSHIGQEDDKISQKLDGVIEPKPITDQHKQATIILPKLPEAGMKQEMFSLDTGNVMIQWPSSMTKESFQDFSDWLEILKRKIKRSVDSPDSGSSNG